VEKAASPDASATAVAALVRVLKNAARSGISRRSNQLEIPTPE
jgi:hypothetical protein